MVRCGYWGLTASVSCGWGQITLAIHDLPSVGRTERLTGAETQAERSVAPVLACFWRFSFYLSPEVIVGNSFALAYLLFSDIQNALKFR